MSEADTDSDGDLQLIHSIESHRAGESSQNVEEEEDKAENEIEDGGNGEDERPATNPLRKRKFPSPVWNYSTFLSKELAVCQVPISLKDGSKKACGVQIKTGGGNTTAIKSHIEKHHSKSDEWKELKKALETKQAAAKSKKKEKLKEAESSMESQGKLEKFFVTKPTIDKSTKERIDRKVEDYLILNYQSFSTVESTAFRAMMYEANRGYVCPSRFTVARNIMEKRLPEAKSILIKELKQSISPHFRLNATIDGGNSQDKMKTKKNTVMVHFTDPYFRIKSELIAMPTAEGKQDGRYIRNQVKEELTKVGFDQSWSLNVTTDAASAAQSASAPNRHHDVGLTIQYRSDCVDHQFHLMIEECLNGTSDKKIKQLSEMSAALRKTREFVTSLNQSNGARQFLVQCQERVFPGDKPIAPMMGTINRWFHKLKENERLILLEEPVKYFDAHLDGLKFHPSDIEEEEWDLIKRYCEAVKIFESTSKYLCSATEPIAGKVIPMLDHLRGEIGKLLKRSEFQSGEPKQFVANFLLSFKKRFPNCWKDKAPFNALTFVDPSNTDIYFTEDELQNVTKTIKEDPIYDEDKSEIEHSEEIAETTEEIDSTSSSESRRELLLKKKRKQQLKPAVQKVSNLPFNERMDAEIKR